MNIVVSGKHVELTDALKQYAHEKFGKLQNYFENILHIAITLSVTQTKAKEEGQSCEVTLSASGIVLRAHETAQDLYAAIDLCVDKMERQIKKYNEKLKERVKHKGREVQATHSIISPTVVSDDESQSRGPQIIRSKQFALKPMFVDEAAMQLNLLDQDFVVFHNAESDEVNVVYRMSDGNVGLIEPDYN